MPPFLSVITRCCRRPAALEKNRLSLANQSDPDYEQILLHDDTQHGMLWANSQFYHARQYPEGRYIYLLDDDDYLTEKDFIRILKKEARAQGQPDVLVFRFDHVKEGIMPSACWHKRPQPGQIGGSCFVVRRTVWRAHIKEFCQKSYGDYHFIKALWNADASFGWIDKVMGRIGQKGGGRRMEI